jgi:hypothetical protein
MSLLSLANIEALAQQEGGTPAGHCFLYVTFSTTNGFKEFCDTRTDNETIYPCPTSSSYGPYLNSAQDRCTK